MRSCVSVLLLLRHMQALLQDRPMHAWLDAVVSLVVSGVIIHRELEKQ